MNNILVTFSGGRTSAFMAKYIKERYFNDNLLFVFANTGKENEETLIFADKCDKAFNLGLVWLEADIDMQKGNGTNYKIVSFETANRNGEPFEKAIQKYGLPSKMYRHCTRELKQVPIQKYAKDYFNDVFVTALGIRADEKHRLSSRENVIYPLADINIDERFIRKWWAKQTFDLKLKDYQGNCDLCFQKSKRKRLTIISENPDIANWWANMENLYSTEYQSLFDVRGNVSITQLIELSNQPFQKQLDKQQIKSLEFDYEEDSCFCSR
jgi:hypothetical protein